MKYNPKVKLLILYFYDSVSADNVNRSNLSTMFTVFWQLYLSPSFIHTSGASVDGIYNGCGVEVKCPISLKDEDLNKLTSKQLKRWNVVEKIDKNKTPLNPTGLTLKESHAYYTQCQIQMEVLGFDMTYFVL